MNENRSTTVHGILSLMKTIQPKALLLVAFLLLPVAAPDVAAADGPAEPVGRATDGRTITPVNQVLTPMGRQVELPGLRPQAIALSPDGRLAVTSGKTNEIVVVDPATGDVRQRVQPAAEEITRPADADRNLKPDTKAIESFTGLRFAPDGRRLYMSNVHGSV